MIAMHACTMDVIEAAGRVTAEMAGIIAVEGAVAIHVPEGAVAAPIAIHERPVSAVIIAVIIVGAGRHGDVAVSNSDATRQREAGDEDGQDKFPQHVGLLRSQSLPIGRNAKLLVPDAELA
jgi:hypothetical protein